MNFDSLIFIVMAIALPLACVAAALFVVRLLRAARPKPRCGIVHVEELVPDVADTTSAPEADEDFDAARTWASSGGTLVVSESRRQVDEKEFYHPTPETELGLASSDISQSLIDRLSDSSVEDAILRPQPEHERVVKAKRPAPKSRRTIETGTAYEARCQSRACKFAWRIAGLLKRPPETTALRCPACHGYDIVAKGIFRVKHSGSVVLLGLAMAAISACGPPQQARTKNDVAGVGSGATVAIADTASTAAVASALALWLPPPSQGPAPERVGEPIGFRRSSPGELLLSLHEALLSRDLASLARIRLSRSVKSDLDIDDLARAQRDFSSNGRDVFWHRVLGGIDSSTLKVEGSVARMRSRVGGSLGEIEVVFQLVGDEWELSAP
jgi:hypothetical protein